jgi:LuxR family maltose regulon positive regulatory protein
MAQIAWMADLFGGNLQEAPLLDTKLHIPRMRPGTVPRARLVHMLDAALHCRLTIISAPPGFGKTTLVASWLACSASGIPVAWVS